MNIIEKNEGVKIDYTISGNKIIFNDELTLNIQKYERDYEVNIDICKDKYGCLVSCVNSEGKYVAQIVIPAREYEEIESVIDNETVITRNAVDFDIDKCTLVLWGMEG